MVPCYQQESLFWPYLLFAARCSLAAKLPQGDVWNVSPDKWKVLDKTLFSREAVDLQRVYIPQSYSFYGTPMI
jgi:hypothetical protein